MAHAALERAAKAKDAKTQLAELLIAWRALRHPRVADLIDRLDAKLLATAGRITARSVPARAEALISAAKTKNPLDVGRVLASEWPKAWQAELPVLQAVCEAPDDPRVAKKLAALVDLAAHQSRGASGFWYVTFHRLNDLGDVRQLPILEAQLGRSKSRYYREGSQEREEKCVEVHRALKIAALSSADAALLQELEAPFAVTSSSEKTRKRSGKELLELVWANPTDPGVRAVYGDWLVEHADPRGELIALQLAAPTEKSRRRIELLVEKHWKTWLGPLADWFRVAPRFELGFPVTGIVAQPSYDDGRERLVPLLEHGEWSTFRELAMPWKVVTPAELVTLPRFKALTGLHQLEPDLVPALADTKPALSTLAFWFGRTGAVLAENTWDQFERLERITCSPQTLGAVLSGFGSRTLKTLELDLSGGWLQTPFDDWWPQLDRSPVEAVELRYSETTVKVTRARSAEGFTRAHVIKPTSLQRLVLGFPPAMTHLTCEPGPLLEAEKTELEHFEKQLARYTKLEVREVPFTLEAPHVGVSIEGAAYSDEAIVKVWELSRDHLGVTFDRVQVGSSSNVRPLGDDPKAMLAKTARSRRDSWLYLEKQHADARVGMSRQSMQATVPVTRAESVFEWILAVLEFGGAEVNIGLERYDRIAFKAATLKENKAQVLKALST
ncbi:MAG: TIGR02996 domain-containing protein [Myxococcales bacterium]|nr:TIGR02996 domain-containing protein [Myxococcales bacterium]